MAEETIPAMIVGIDDSEHSLYALQWTLDHFFPAGKPAPFKLVVVHSKPVPSSVVGLGGPGVIDVLPYLESDLKRTAARVIETAKELCAASSLTDVTYEVVEGDARNVLCEAVEKHQAHILVVGSHGYGAIKRAVLGSTTMTEQAPNYDHRMEEEVIFQTPLSPTHKQKGVPRAKMIPELVWNIAFEENGSLPPYSHNTYEIAWESLKNKAAKLAELKAQYVALERRNLFLEQKKNEPMTVVRPAQVGATAMAHPIASSAFSNRGTPTNVPAQSMYHHWIGIRESVVPSPMSITFNTHNLESLVAMVVERQSKAHYYFLDSHCHANKFLEEISASPFLNVIDSIVIDRKLQMSKFNTYDETRCPQTHIVHVKGLVSIMP